MTGMTGFVRRGFCLAAVALLMSASGVGAQTKYVVSAGTTDGMFVVKRNGSDVAGGEGGVAIASAMNAIRIDARGGAVEINFDTSGMGLYIGTNSIRIERSLNVSPNWGNVKVSGAVKSKTPRNSGALYLSSDSGVFAVNAEVNISVVDGAEGDAIQLDKNVSLRMDACTLSTGVGNGVNNKASLNGTGVQIYSSKITTNGGHAVYNTGSPTKINGGEFVSKGSYAVYAYAGLNVTGSRFKSSRNGVYSRGVFNIVDGEVECESGNAFETNGGGGEISGGSFRSLRDGSALVVGGGNVLISRGAKFYNGSDNNATVHIGADSVRLDGATIMNEGAGRAVYMASASSKLVLSGFNQARIEGRVAAQFAGALCVDYDFSPYDNKYVLELLRGAYAEGAVAVVGGAKDSASFVCRDNNHELKIKGKDLVVALRQEVGEPSYVIDGSVIDGFGVSLKVGSANESLGQKSGDIEGAIASIKKHAGGRPCSIEFGGGKSGLSFSTVWGISFDAGWGRVKLSGNILQKRKTGAREATYALRVTDGVSVVSSLNIQEADDFHGGVYIGPESEFTLDSGFISNKIVNGGGVVTINGGSVPYIENEKGGSLDIFGGTVGSDTRNGYAIKNCQTCETYISGDAEVVSADTNYNGGTIVNGGVLEIDDGSVSNVGVSYFGTSIAISSDGDVNDTTGFPEVYITGAANIFSKSASSYNGVIRNNWGKMEISGGEVYSTADTVGAVVVNYGNLAIFKSAEIRSGKYNPSATIGVVHSEVSKNISETESALTISGGTIIAKDGYAVSVGGTGGATISEDAVITSADTEGVIYICPDGYLNLLGGVVSSTADTSNASIKMVKAIDAYEGGRGGSAGRLVMGGSPIVNGIISLPGKDRAPIEIIVDSGYVFNPPRNKIYHIAMSAVDGGVVVKNGVGFRHNFSLDTTGNKDLNLAVNGNDLVAARNIYSVAFDLNGADSAGRTPDPIIVMAGGTIGDSAKPSTENYIRQNTMYVFTNDGKWHIRNGAGGGVTGDDVFKFGVGINGTMVTKQTTLTLYWKDSIEVPVSVLEPTRDLPAPRPAETAAIAPIAAAPGSLTAGPSPVSSSAVGTVSFFRSGAALKEGKLFIYDASGSMVATVSVNDPSGNTVRRPIAKWNLQDAKGRKVAEGTYVARGVITTKAGKTERVSVLVSVQR